MAILIPKQKWFGESGGGIQYKFNSSINELINPANGILREVK